jgi:hypothetical protein
MKTKTSYEGKAQAYGESILPPVGRPRQGKGGWRCERGRFASAFTVLTKGLLKTEERKID